MLHTAHVRSAHRRQQVCLPTTSSVHGRVTLSCIRTHYSRGASHLSVLFDTNEYIQTVREQATMLPGYFLFWLVCCVYGPLFGAVCSPAPPSVGVRRCFGRHTIGTCPALTVGALHPPASLTPVERRALLCTCNGLDVGRYHAPVRCAVGVGVDGGGRHKVFSAQNCLEWLEECGVLYRCSVPTIPMLHLQFLFQ